jgi:hypothetical protein
MLLKIFFLAEIKVGWMQCDTICPVRHSELHERIQINKLCDLAICTMFLGSPGLGSDRLCGLMRPPTAFSDSALLAQQICHNMNWKYGKEKYIYAMLGGNRRCGAVHWPPLPLGRHRNPLFWMLHQCKPSLRHIKLHDSYVSNEQTLGA